jgi:hypothetical protein
LGYTPHGGLVDKLNVLSVFLVLCALGQAATITALPGGGATGDILVNSIVGPGITVLPGSISLVGADNQQGTFVNGAASVGLANGIVLTSGSAAALNGVNASSPETLSLGGSGTNSWDAPMFLAGDALLTTLAGNATYDANVLSFSFQFGDGSVGGDLYFSFVFVSEEYIDFANSPWNDVFGFYVDDTNVALIGGQPISVNNINPVNNPGSYINNVANTNGFPVAGRAIQADGLTTVLVAQRLGLAPGTHRMSFRIADVEDSSLDSGVFIGGGSFSNVNPNSVPEPGTWAMTIGGFALAGLLKWRGPRRG